MFYLNGHLLVRWCNGPWVPCLAYCANCRVRSGASAKYLQNQKIVNRYNSNSHMKFCLIKIINLSYSSFILTNYNGLFQQTNNQNEWKERLTTKYAPTKLYAYYRIQRNITYQLNSFLPLPRTLATLNGMLRFST